MKTPFLLAFALAFVAAPAFRTRVSAAADAPIKTAVYRASDTPVVAQPVRYGRVYYGYRPYYRPYRPYYAYRPYYVARPYAFTPNVYGSYGPAYYPYVYPSLRSPYYVGYRYPGAVYRGYYRRPRVYFGYGW